MVGNNLRESPPGAETTLVDELHALQDRLTALSEYDKLVLDLAAVLAEDLHKIRTGSLPNRITTIPIEDYLEDRLPGQWEFVDGRPTPKHWKARSATMHAGPGVPPPG